MKIYNSPYFVSDLSGNMRGGDQKWKSQRAGKSYKKNWRAYLTAQKPVEPQPRERVIQRVKKDGTIVRAQPDGSN